MGNNKFKNKNHSKDFKSNKEMAEEKNEETIKDPSAGEFQHEIENIEEPAVEAGKENTCEDFEKKIEELNEQLEKEKKEYLFLMAEFDNFRKRTLKEKSEIIKNAGENVLKGLLPIMDDFERGLKAAQSNPDSDSMKEGVNIIYNKLQKYLNQNGVKEIDPSDVNFDTEKHEAISAIPVPDEDKKGKILDTVEKGYMINDKVLRHAKVVVGQ